MSVDYKVKYTQQLQVIKDNYATFAVPYNGEDNNDYVDGKGFCCNDGSLEAAQTRALARAAKNNFQEGDTYEKMQFYYHPDHLGSSSYITNLDGEVVQHIEYVPFGEVFVEERNNIWNTPYLFNAKEFDEETGLYYYGARYYDPRVSLWISTDPQQENDVNISTYTYCGNNPVLFTDPDGEIFGIDNVVGAIASGAIEVGSQVVSNIIQSRNATDINWKKVGIASGEGFITSGASTGVRIAVKIGSAVANSLVDNYNKGGNEIVKGTLSNLAEGAVVKGGSKTIKAVGNKVLNKAFNKVSNKIIHSKTSIAKSVKKQFGTNSKVSNKIATKIQTGQKHVAKAIRKSPQTLAEIYTPGIFEKISNRNEKKK